LLAGTGAQGRLKVDPERFEKFTMPKGQWKEAYFKF